jgi:3-oxoacyl-[acyl-carrier protein] reductase
MRYRDRAVIVTGAASGFGEATAKRFASEGASVVVADVDAAGGRRTAGEIVDAGGAAVFVETDVSQSSDVKKMVETALGELGRLDVIVNNAGIAHRMMPLAELPESDYDRVFATNAKSVYLSAVHGVPVLVAQGGGAIVNIASIGAVRPRPNMTAYNATKGAVLTLTRGLAAELAPQRIRVNAVNPLAADTNFMKAALGVETLPPPIREALVADVPLGRLTLPSDVATAVLFLASDEAEFLTGVCIDVDGGKGI